MDSIGIAPGLQRSDPVRALFGMRAETPRIAGSTLSWVPGGRPDMAQAGGPNGTKAAETLAAIEAALAG